MKRDLQVKECEDGGYEIARVIAESESIVEWECLAQVHDEDDARLFAAAPKMREMLAEVYEQLGDAQWDTTKDYGTQRQCSECFGSRKHTDECRRAKLLRELAALLANGGTR